MSKNKHLPECDKYASVHHDPECICQWLRDCERRVRNDLNPDGKTYRDGFLEGANAAHHAVMRLEDFPHRAAENGHRPVDAIWRLAALNAISGVKP